MEAPPSATVETTWSAAAAGVPVAVVLAKQGDPVAPASAESGQAGGEIAVGGNPGPATVTPSKFAP